MCGDLFSSFDFYAGSVLGLGSIMVFSLVIFVSGLVLMGGHIAGRLAVVDGLLSSVVSSLSRSVVLVVSGVSSLGSVLFSLLLAVNFMGLVPYVFSVSSHVSFTFSLGLVVWVSVVVSCVALDSASFLVHMCPFGAPLALSWFLSLIEVVSICLRPITLSVRLAANMSAGHVVLGLIGGSMSVSFFSAAALLPVGVGYLFFELMVCFIQGFVFYLLSALYFDEHS
uniref:ATP synthase subunit a n=1 Tax=Litigonotus ghinii TaxID=3104745 RepID=A0AAU8MHA9_9BILA